MGVRERRERPFPCSAVSPSGRTKEILPSSRFRALPPDEDLHGNEWMWELEAVFWMAMNGTPDR